ncbi:hypothetical protein KW803_01205 [Candidatus Saccharibacteria bacterium]|nr:hypothetical protein [Candidatus Saccharibacteria bacterium]
MDVEAVGFDEDQDEVFRAFETRQPFNEGIDDDTHRQFPFVDYRNIHTETLVGVEKRIENVADGSKFVSLLVNPSTSVNRPLVRRVVSEAVGNLYEEFGRIHLVSFLAEEQADCNHSPG